MATLWLLSTSLQIGSHIMASVRCSQQQLPILLRVRLLHVPSRQVGEAMRMLALGHPGFVSIMGVCHTGSFVLLFQAPLQAM